MKVIAQIDDTHMIERILNHLGILAPRQNALRYEHPPPRGGPYAGAAMRAPNVRSYKPVPDVARPYPYSSNLQKTSHGTAAFLSLDGGATGV